MTAPLFLFAALGLLQGSAAAVAALQQDQCPGDREVDSTTLLQSMASRVKKKIAAKSGEGCYPCRIVETSPGRDNFVMDIYVPQEPTGEGLYPLVIAHHGHNGNPSWLRGRCQSIFTQAGFACAAIHPVSEVPKFYTDDAIEYFMKHSEYNVDPNMVILYGSSKGGRGMYQYMFHAETERRCHVKGFIEDVSTPVEFDWEQKDAEGNYLKFPPLLMLYCEGKTWRAPWSPELKQHEKAIKNINCANKVRAPDEQIRYHAIAFSNDTGCTDEVPQLVSRSWDAAVSTVSFINSIVAGEEDPFVGFPEVVSGQGKVDAYRRRRGKPIWEERWRRG